MRPSLLDPLFVPLTSLPGVGPKLEKLYRRLLGRDDAPARVADLLFHLPSEAVDRRARPKLRDVEPGSSQPSPSPSIATGRRRPTVRARPIRSTPATRPAT
jgi:ATP-dependent DNA helicase RecG